MSLKWAGAVALCVPLAVPGCTPMPEIEPVSRLAERRLTVGEPFVYQATGEPLDVSDDVPDPLKLDDALLLSLRHHPGIQVALARLRQAEAEARQTRLLPNPVIGVALRFPSGGGETIIDANLSAELLSLVTRPGRIAAVDHRLRRASAEALTAVLDAAVELRQQYAEAQALDARLVIAEARRSILGDVLDITNARLEAGETSRLDVLTARGELSRLDSELLELRNEQRLARVTLARLIGRPSAQADWMLAPASMSEEPPLAEHEWIRLALENRPELAAIRWELAALGQEVRLAKAQTMLGGEVGVVAERDDTWSVGPAVSLPLPVFDNGTVAKQLRLDMVAEQSHALTQAGRMVIEEVRHALESLTYARAGLEAAQRELLPLREQRLRQEREAYQAGLTDITSLRLAEQDLQEAKSRVIDLGRQVSRARFDLDRAVGGSGVYRNDPQARDTQSTSPQPTE